MYFFVRAFEQQSIYLHTDLNLVPRYRRGLYQRQRPSYLCTTFSMTSKLFLKTKKKEKKWLVFLKILFFFVYFFMDINRTKIVGVVRITFSMLFCVVEVQYFRFLSYFSFMQLAKSLTFIKWIDVMAMVKNASAV